MTEGCRGGLERLVRQPWPRERIAPVERATDRVHRRSTKLRLDHAVGARRRAVAHGGDRRLQECIRRDDAVEKSELPAGSNVDELAFEDENAPPSPSHP